MRRLSFVVVLASACTTATAPAPRPRPLVAVAPAPDAEPAPEPAPERAPAPVPAPESVPERAPAQVVDATPGYAPTSEDVLLLQQVVQAMEEIARVMEANPDCDRMVDGLERIAVRVRPLIARAKGIETQKERSAWFKHQAEAQLTATVQRMLAPLQRCAQNKRLLALMQSLGS